MARHKGFRGLAGLGSAAGSKAVESVRRSVLAYRSAFRDAQQYAGTDPAKALAAVARAKKALVDAEAGINLARAARVMVPGQYVNDFKAAVSTVGDLSDLAKRASDLAQEMTQVDPDWGNSRYGSAMPDPRPANIPGHWDNSWSEGFMGLGRGRGRRGCCAKRRR